MQHKLYLKKELLFCYVRLQFFRQTSTSGNTFPIYNFILLSGTPFFPSLSEQTLSQLHSLLNKKYMQNRYILIFIVNIIAEITPYVIV